MATEIKVVRGCDFPEGQGQLQITFNGAKRTVSVYGTKDILRFLCEVAAQDPNFEKKISSYDDINFIEQLETIDEEDRVRGFAFPEGNEKWFVDYSFLVSICSTHNACYLLIELLLNNAEVTFIAAEVSKPEVDMSTQNRGLGVANGNSLQNVTGTSPLDRISANGGSWQNILPPPNKDDQTILGQLDRAVCERVKNGESALQIALADSMEGIDGDWYDEGIRELRTRVGERSSYESIEGILCWTKYASKILWFRTAFEDPEFVGGNAHAKGFRNKLAGGNEFYTPMRLFGLKPPFEFNESPNKNDGSPGFNDYVWFLSNAKNSSSRLRWGLRAAVAGSAEVDRFGLVSTLLTYSDDDLWHRGRDFRAFVDWFKSGGRPTDANIDDWMARIGRDFLAAFPRYDDANADCGFYLHWHKEGALPPSPIFGISKVRLQNGYDSLIVGWDDRAQEISLPARMFANDGIYSIPIEGVGIDYKVIARGLAQNDCQLYPLRNENVPLVDDISYGVFCRVAEGVRDVRRDWWMRLSPDDVVSNRKRELLVVIPGSVNSLQITDCIGGGVSWIHCGQPHYFHGADKTAFVLTVDGRPQTDTSVQIQDWEIQFAAAVPVIDYAHPGWVLPVDEGMSVCRNGELLTVCDVDGVAADDIRWWAKRATGGEWSCKGVGNTICVDSLLDEGERTFVECRVNGRQKRAAVCLMRLPETVVEFVGNGTELPQGWNVTVRSELAFARRGYELVDVCRVNAVGINGEALVSFKRPLRNFTWWIEPENGGGTLNQEGFGLNVPSLVGTDAYIAFPDNFVDEISVRVDDRGLDPAVSRQMMIEYCGYRRVKIRDLVNRLYLEYEVGNVNEHSIYINNMEVARFKFRPSSPCLSRHQDGRIGVYFPAARTSARVAIFTDDVTSEMFADETGMLFRDVRRGNEDFVEIGDFVAECRLRSPNGELFGVVVPPHAASNINRELLGGNGVVKLSEGVGENLPVPVDRSVKCWIRHQMTSAGWLDDLRDGHPYFSSRVARFRRNVLEHGNLGDWWFENDNGEQDGHRNESRDYDDVEDKKFCIIGGVSLPKLWQGFVLPPVQGSQVVRIKLKDLVRLARSKRGNLLLDENGMLLHELKLCDGQVVCRVNLLGGQPLLCRKRVEGLNGKCRLEWGVYLPTLTNISPVVVLYTDNPQSDFFPDGHRFCIESSSKGFHSIQCEIDAFIATRDEVYVALYSVADVDHRISSGAFLDEERCQLICVIAREGELPPPEWGCVIDSYSGIVGQIEASGMSVSGTAWERSRIWNVAQSARRVGDSAGCAWLSKGLAQKQSLEQSFDALKRALLDLLLAGYNFLAEPELFFNLKSILEGQNLPWEEWLRDSGAAPGVQQGRGICASLNIWEMLNQPGRSWCKESDCEWRPREAYYCCTQDGSGIGLWRDAKYTRDVVGRLRNICSTMGLDPSGVPIFTDPRASDCTKVAIVAGGLCALNLCHRQNQNGQWQNNLHVDRCLLRDKEDYRVLNGVVYSAFLLRHFSEDQKLYGFWRLLMRAHILMLKGLRNRNLMHFT